MKTGFYLTTALFNLCRYVSVWDEICVEQQEYRFIWCIFYTISSYSA